jgi:hypothetical protein
MAIDYISEKFQLFVRVTFCNLPSQQVVVCRQTALTDIRLFLSREGSITVHDTDFPLLLFGTIEQPTLAFSVIRIRFFRLP